MCRYRARGELNFGTEMMAGVSVIVPAYNAAGTIERAVVSALAQTLEPSEIIVVDDCSSDGTVDLVARRFGAEPRVRVLSTSANSGPSRARNVAIAAARGDWIALLDADDAWLPERLDTLLRQAEEYDIVADNLLAFDDKTSEVVGRLFRRNFHGRVGLREFLDEVDLVDLGLLKPLIRRDFFVRNAFRYDERMRYAEDMMLYCEMLCAGGRFRVLDYAGYIYTTPYGRSSRVKSPHSHTSVDDAALIAALEALVSRNRLADDPSAMAAVKRRIGYYERRRHWDTFASYFFDRNYRGLVATALRHPSIAGFLLRRLRSRVSRLLDRTDNSRSR